MARQCDRCDGWHVDGVNCPQRNDYQFKFRVKGAHHETTIEVQNAQVVEQAEIVVRRMVASLTGIPGIGMDAMLGEPMAYMFSAGGRTIGYGNLIEAC